MNTTDHNTYMCITGTNEDEIRARFVKRYGTQPEKIFHMAGMLWAGPVPDEYVNADLFRTPAKAPKTGSETSL